MISTLLCLCFFLFPLPAVVPFLFIFVSVKGSACTREAMSIQLPCCIIVVLAIQYFYVGNVYCFYRFVVTCFSFVPVNHFAIPVVCMRV